MALEAITWVRALAASGEARTIRERARLSVSEVARALGVSPSAVSRWERGERAPRGEVAARWAQLLRRLSR